MATLTAPPGTPADEGSRPDDVPALARRLDIALPPECVPGVRHHMQLLDQHWAMLKAFLLPQA